MSEDQKRLFEQQLWNIANTLRGKMNADEYTHGSAYTTNQLNQRNQRNHTNDIIKWINLKTYTAYHQTGVPIGIIPVTAHISLRWLPKTEFVIWVR